MQPLASAGQASTRGSSHRPAGLILPRREARCCRQPLCLLSSCAPRGGDRRARRGVCYNPGRQYGRKKRWDGAGHVGVEPSGAQRQRSTQRRATATIGRVHLRHTATTRPARPVSVSTRTMMRPVTRLRPRRTTLAGRSGGLVAANNRMKAVTDGSRAFVPGRQRLGHCQRAAPPAASMGHRA